ncbi:methylenetetrahydrofolate reductase [Castellaniella sp. GW247-6E4]|uniref:methylenetetrahydrofolate reductase n=1 Tax=Castellaniella sp. GW247-6E4 TaxID=3140380 RepID=UPI0033156E57
MDLETACATASHGPDMDSLLSGYSLEMTANGLPALERAAYAITPGTPISITFLPGEDYAARVRAAQGVRRLGFVPVPHLSARRIGGAAELEGFMTALVDAAQVDRVFVVGGDPDRPLGPYADALALIRSGVLMRHGVRQAGIAGYPEGHPAIPADRLWGALADKSAALSEQGIRPFIVTQFGFEAAPILGWLDELRARDVACPVRIGLPGPARMGTLLRYAAQCGVGASARVMSRYGLSITRLINTVGPAALVSDLVTGLGGARGVALHFYAFGGFQNTAEWIRSLREARHG